MNLVFVAEVRDGCSVDQMASQNGHFLIRRVLITSLGHDENLLSNYSLLEKGFSPFSLGAKQNGSCRVHESELNLNYPPPTFN
jgi:hypothetical protein